MEEFLSAVIILLIGVSIWAFTTFKKLKDTEKLKRRVAWSVCESDSVRYNIPLWAHLKDVQLRAHMLDEYRIAGEEEWKTAKEIIGRYQQDLWQSYFNNWLSALNGSSIYAIQDRDYFIFRLYVYLCEHDRYEKNIVFHKMQYITYMYCKEHPGLQKLIPAWNESRLKEQLDDDLGKKKAPSYRIPVPGDSGIKVNYRGRP